MKADIVKAQTVMNHLNIHNFKVWHSFEEGRGGGQCYLVLIICIPRSSAVAMAHSHSL